MQYYSLNAAFLWAAIVISAVLGIGVYLLVVGVESWILRHERRVDPMARMTMDATPPGPRSRPVVEICRRRRRCSPRAARAAGPVEALVGIDLSVSGRRVHLAHRAVRLRQVDAAADRRRPDRARRRARSTVNGKPATAGPPRPRLRDGLPGADPVRLAVRPGQRRAAARDQRHAEGRARPPGRASTSPSSSCPTSPATTRGSCRAACSSASPSPGRWRSTRRSC